MLIILPPAPIPILLAAVGKHPPHNRWVGRGARCARREVLNPAPYIRGVSTPILSRRERRTARLDKMGAPSDPAGPRSAAADCQDIAGSDSPRCRCRQCDSNHAAEPIWRPAAESTSLLAVNSERAEVCESRGVRAVPAPERVSTRPSQQHNAAPRVAATRPCTIEEGEMVKVNFR